MVIEWKEGRDERDYAPIHYAKLGERVLLTVYDDPEGDDVEWGVQEQLAGEDVGGWSAFWEPVAGDFAPCVADGKRAAEKALGLVSVPLDKALEGPEAVLAWLATDPLDEVTP